MELDRFLTRLLKRSIGKSELEKVGVDCENMAVEMVGLFVRADKEGAVGVAGGVEDPKGRGGSPSITRTRTSSGKAAVGFDDLVRSRQRIRIRGQGRSGIRGSCCGCWRGFFWGH